MQFEMVELLPCPYRQAQCWSLRLQRKVSAALLGHETECRYRQAYQHTFSLAWQPRRECICQSWGMCSATLERCQRHLSLLSNSTDPRSKGCRSCKVLMTPGHKMTQLKLYACELYACKVSEPVPGGSGMPHCPSPGNRIVPICPDLPTLQILSYCNETRVSQPQPRCRTRLNSTGSSNKAGPAGVVLERRPKAHHSACQGHERASRDALHGILTLQAS